MGSAALARAWVEVEAMKRRMRGVAELSQHKLSELADAKVRAAKHINLAPREVCVEIPPDKESLISSDP